MGKHRETKSWALEEAERVMRVDDAERQSAVGDDVPFVTFMESLYFDGFQLEREEDRGRDVDLSGYDIAS